MVNGMSCENKTVAQTVKLVDYAHTIVQNSNTEEEEAEKLFAKKN